MQRSGIELDYTRKNGLRYTSGRLRSKLVAWLKIGAEAGILGLVIDSTGRR